MALSLNMRNELLATGRFLTVIPGFLLRLSQKHRSLKALRVELPNNRGTFGIVTLKNRTLSPLAKLFRRTRPRNHQTAGTAPPTVIPENGPFRPFAAMPQYVRS